MSRLRAAKPNGISLGMVVVIVMSMSLVLLLAGIKIYLANTIYYESKKVNKVAREVQALKAEKALLEQKVEVLRFKNRVTDTIFVVSDEPNEFDE